MVVATIGAVVVENEWTDRIKLDILLCKQSHQLTIKITSTVAETTRKKKKNIVINE